MRLSGKVALITGASKGIGRAIAIAYAKEGASLVINGRNLVDLKKVEEEISAIGRDVLALPADVTVHRQVKEMFAEGVKRFGRVDILVNNAGKMFFGSIEEISEEEWDEALQANLKGDFLCSREAVPLMKKNHRGSIINLSSTAGKSAGTITGVNYAVAKAGIMYLSKRMAHDLAKYGITVNCISPGPVDTAMSRSFDPSILSSAVKAIPLGRIGQPEDVAKLAVFLGSDDASYITGEVIDINGGSFID
jgi:3-oxoacyl-[acyl-carrier protein] reductase